MGNKITCRRQLVLVGTVCVLLSGNAAAITSLDTTTINRSVVFFFDSDSNGNVLPERHDATGFLIAVPHKDGKRIRGFLVTARHVVDPVWAGCGLRNPTKLFARVNTTAGDSKKDDSKVAFVPIELVRDGKPLWTTSDDDTVDVAVLDAPQELISGKYDVQLLRFRGFGKVEEIAKLGVGSQVSSSGLVPGAAGERRNNPIFQFGKIASIPGELVPIRCQPSSQIKSLRVWWIAANLVPGTSGSPVFFDPLFPPGADITAGEPRPMLIGLQSMSLPGANLAGMAPGKYIVDVISKMCGKDDVDLSVGPPPATPVPQPPP